MILNFMTESEWVTLYTEDGEEIICEILRKFDVAGTAYAAIRPAEGDETVEEGIFVCRYYEEEDGTIELEDIDNDEELDAVSAAYEQLQKVDEM